MKISISRNSLTRAFHQVSEALGKSGPHEMLIFSTRPSDGQMSLYASNSLLYASAQVEALSMDGEGRFAVSGKDFASLLSTVDVPEVGINVNHSGYAQFEVGQAQVRLPTVSIERVDIPSPPQVESSQYTPSVVISALGYLKSFVGSSGRRLDLAIAELIEGSFYASDGSKMGIFQNAELTGSLLIQASAFPALTLFLKNMREGEKVSVRQSENLTWWVGSDAWMAHRKDHRSFPRQLITISQEASPRAEVVVDAARWLTAIQRLRVPMDSRDHKLALEISNSGSLAMVTWNSMNVSSTDSIPVDTVSEGSASVKATLNIRSLEEALSSSVLKSGPVTLKYLPSIRAFEISSSKGESGVRSVLGIIS